MGCRGETLTPAPLVFGRGNRTPPPRTPFPLHTQPSALQRVPALVPASWWHWGKAGGATGQEPRTEGCCQGYQK